MSGELVERAAALGRELRTTADDAGYCGCGNCEARRMAREQVEYVAPVPSVCKHCGSWLASAYVAERHECREQVDDGTNGQDRESYSDDQDRDSYTVDEQVES